MNVDGHTQVRSGETLFFKIVFSVLAFIGAVVVLGILAIVVLYLLLVRRVTERVRRSLEEFEELENARGRTIDAVGSHLIGEDDSEPVDRWEADVPPMRIHLVPANAVRWIDIAVVDRISVWLARHDFHLQGDFELVEMANERLRVYLSSDKLLVAAIRQDDFGNTPYVEFCFDLGAGQRGGVSNPPPDTIPLPQGAVGRHFNYDFEASVRGLSKMLDCARTLVAENRVLPVPNDGIQRFFEEAHAAEMNTRIAHGGLMRYELEAALGGRRLASVDVDEIQWNWQEAIEQFLVAQSVRVMELDDGEDIFAVYDASRSSFLFDRVQGFYEDLDEFETDQLKSVLGELEIMLQRFSPREAMARFRPLLPEALRYDLIDQVRTPVVADLYLLPHYE